MPKFELYIDDVVHDSADVPEDDPEYAMHIFLHERGWAVHAPPETHDQMYVVRVDD